MHYSIKIAGALCLAASVAGLIVAGIYILEWLSWEHSLLRAIIGG